MAPLGDTVVVVAVDFVIDDDVVVVVDPRNIPLKFDQNWIRNY